MATFKARKPVNTIAPLELVVGLLIQGIRFTHFENISRNVGTATETIIARYANILLTDFRRII